VISRIIVQKVCYNELIPERLTIDPGCFGALPGYKKIFNANFPYYQKVDYQLPES